MLQWYHWWLINKILYKMFTSSGWLVVDAVWFEGQTPWNILPYIGYTEEHHPSPCLPPTQSTDTCDEVGTSVESRLPVTCNKLLGGMHSLCIFSIAKIAYGSQYSFNSTHAICVFEISIHFGHFILLRLKYYIGLLFRDDYKCITNQNK